MTIDLTEVITAVAVALVGVFGTLITTYFVPWLKSKLTMNQQYIVAMFADTAVKAAQELYTASSEKRVYAMKRLETDLLAKGIVLDSDQLRGAIEAALKDIKLSLPEGKW